MAGVWKMWFTGFRPSALLGLAILVFLIGACGSGREASLEVRAQSIDKSLICPVCPGETIDQAQVALAHQMKAIVREKLADGWTREQILQFFVDRYGEGVLAAPPKSGFNLVAWVVPFAAVVAAAALVFFVIRSMRRSGGTGQEHEPLADPELQPYLSLVDQELGIDQARLEGGDLEGSQESEREERGMPRP